MGTRRIVERRCRARHTRISVGQDCDPTPRPMAQARFDNPGCISSSGRRGRSKTRLLRLNSSIPVSRRSRLLLVSRGFPAIQGEQTMEDKILVKSSFSATSNASAENQMPRHQARRAFLMIDLRSDTCSHPRRRCGVPWRKQQSELTFTETILRCAAARRAYGCLTRQRGCRVHGYGHYDQSSRHPGAHRAW
jgi:hypothetical protein